MKNNLVHLGLHPHFGDKVLLFEYYSVCDRNGEIRPSLSEVLRCAYANYVYICAYLVYIGFYRMECLVQFVVSGGMTLKVTGFGRCGVKAAPSGTLPGLVIGPRGGCDPCCQTRMVPVLCSHA